MVWSSDTYDAKMLLDISFPMNYVIINQLSLNLVDICLHDTLRIICKSLLCFAKIGTIDYSKIARPSLSRKDTATKFARFSPKFSFF